jgi:hypothetical protein
LAHLRECAVRSCPDVEHRARQLLRLDGRALRVCQREPQRRLGQALAPSDPQPGRAQEFLAGASVVGPLPLPGQDRGYEVGLLHQLPGVHAQAHLPDLHLRIDNPS